MLFVKYAIRSQHPLAMTPGNWWNTIANFKKDILIEFFLALLKNRTRKIKMLPNEGKKEKEVRLIFSDSPNKRMQPTR